MIPDLKLDRHMPSSFYSGLQWSPDGRLAVTCTKNLAGSTSILSGFELLTPVVAKKWCMQDNSDPKSGEMKGVRLEYHSVASWAEGIRSRSKRWKNCVRDGASNSTESNADGTADVAITDMVWSPLWTSSSGGCLLLVLTSSLDAIIFLPPENEADMSRRPWRIGWILSNIVGEIEGVPPCDDDDAEFGTPVGSKKVLERLRIHSIAWSAAIGGLDVHHRAMSILATGNEHGEVYLWRVQEGSPPEILGSTAVSNDWITGLKFAPCVKSVTQPDSVTIYLAVATSGNELYILPIHTTPSTLLAVRFGLSHFASSGPTSFSNITWYPYPDNTLLCVAVRPRRVVLLSVQPDKNTVTTTLRSTSISVPVVGVLFQSSNPTRTQISILSMLGDVATIDYSIDDTNPPSDILSSRLTKLLETRARAYLAIQDPIDHISTTDTRVLGLSTDFFQNATIMYTIAPGKQLRYPITSQQWSRLALVNTAPNTAPGDIFWEIVEAKIKTGCTVSPRALFWGAKIVASTQSGEREEEWVRQALAIVQNKVVSESSTGYPADLQTVMFSSESSFWRRVLTCLYDWALSFGNAEDLKPAAVDNIRQIRITLAVVILKQFLSIRELRTDPASVRVVYQYARYLAYFSSTCGTTDQERLELVLRVLRRIQAEGYSVQDEISDLQKEETQIMMDIGISGVVSDTDDDGAINEGPQEYGTEAKCVACGSLVELNFDNDIDLRAVCCSSEHMWQTCSLTLLPLMDLHQRRCNLCSRTYVCKSYLSSSMDTLISRIIHDSDVCVFCGETLYVM
ncbi:hypothetical protein POJ06DRAFT_129872 [Lipomyces tetrasporus]|uniref:Transcription factor IIIC 90kDa subunit N-terminal domain-containing protein n=1 Tax=Lipomyces tetrasporus TaxID=54092 RepID=A0AAD7VSM8_9ASCO|nr:uncharacterized protein POJ06DRAFT_129872 [Lipomyces tetrasporus]KAJ8099175.1 hypothetical protein POJ06DRAFT_129872 [Lipomyces tetrasporus]